MTLSPNLAALRLLRALLILCIAGLLSSLPAHAEKADQEKPTNIAADHTESDDLHQIDIFTGNVILTKGTIILRCDKLLVHQDPEGYQSGVATWDGVTPVYFKQKREGLVDQYMEGNAERIEYDEKTNTVKLFDHALVKRLQAGKDADETHGDTITYNSENEKYFVTSGKTQPRTHTLIQPKSTEPPGGTPAKVTAGSATPATATPARAAPEATNASAPSGTPAATPGSIPAGGPATSSVPPIAPKPPPVELKPSDTLLTVPQ
jgi:lipopolysaccharide export system protein LptA